MSLSSLGFIGLGAMGVPMVRNLLEAGFAVTVFNRSRGPAEALAREGACLADTPAEAVQPGGVVVTMLANDAALEAVATGPNGFAETLGAGGLHISMSTVSPALSKRLAQTHAQWGSQYLAAPVFGRPPAAAARQLWICQSGPVEARRRARPILEALGQAVHDFGDEVEAANIVKLSGNFLILSAIEAMAEALALAEKTGVDRNALVEFFTHANFACPVYQSYGPLLADRRYKPAGFKLELGMKDIRLVQAVAEAAVVPMPAADLLHARFLRALAKGRGHLDWSAIELSSAEDADIAIDSSFV